MICDRPGPIRKHSSSHQLIPTPSWWDALGAVPCHITTVRQRSERLDRLKIIEAEIEWLARQRWQTKGETGAELWLIWIEPGGSQEKEKAKLNAKNPITCVIVDNKKVLFTRMYKNGTADRILSLLALLLVAYIPFFSVLSVLFRIFSDSCSTLPALARLF